MKIHIASDHAGFEIKNEHLIPLLKERGFEVVDHGASEYDPADDYPTFCNVLAEALKADLDAGTEARGIVLGGSGQGEAMAVNRHKGLRATVYYGGTLDIIKLSREHNNANVLSLGARLMTPDQAKDVVLLWLDTDFSGDERHIRRITMLG